MRSSITADQSCEATLDAHPAWKERLANGDGSEDLAFVEEVRRHYPFFPAVAADCLVCQNAMRK